MTWPALSEASLGLRLDQSIVGTKYPQGSSSLQRSKPEKLHWPHLPTPALARQEDSYHQEGAAAKAVNLLSSQQTLRAT